MIKLFYNSQGTIETVVSMSVDFEDSRPHVITDQDINIDHWRVNMTSLQLESIPEDQRPQRLGRTRP